MPERRARVGQELECHGGEGPQSTVPHRSAKDSEPGFACSDPKTQYASWLVNPKRCKLSEACPDIANDVPGFTLKAEGYKNEQWPEVLRVLQFVGLYEAFRALLDASTAALAGTSGQ